MVIGSDPKFGSFKKTPLFPTVLEPYLYSFTVLFLAFLLALFLSSSMAFFYFLAKDYIKKWINRIVFILEAVPDMMMMICLQIFFIWVLKNSVNLLSPLFLLMKIELIYSLFYL